MCIYGLLCLTNSDSFLNSNKLARFAHLVFAPATVILFLLSGNTLNGKDALVILLSFFFIDNLGLQVGFHKLLAHKSFSTHPFFINLLGFLGLFSGQGSPLVWSVIHRSQHHPFADTNKDPHTPEKGFFHSFIGWYWNIKNINLNTVKDLLKFKFICFIHRQHTLILWSVLLIIFLFFGLKVLVTVFLIPMILSLTLMGLVNACLHSRKKSILDYLLLTYTNYKENNYSKNSILLGPLTAGLGYHNNHHHFPDRFNLGHKWYELDISKLFIYLIKTE